MATSDDVPEYAQSERGEIVKWRGIARDDWHDGPPRDEDEALRVEHYIVKLDTPEGPRYYTVHYPPSADFDLDFEIDRIESEYAEDFA